MFSCAVVPYVALKEVAHGMVCLSESRRGGEIFVTSSVRDAIEIAVYRLLSNSQVTWVCEIKTTFSESNR